MVEQNSFVQNTLYSVQSKGQIFHQCADDCALCTSCFGAITGITSPCLCIPLPTIPPPQYIDPPRIIIGWTIDCSNGEGNCDR